MATDQLIIGTFTECFKTYFYDELVIGQLAHTEFKDGVNKGDEVDLIMPGTVKMFDFDGEGDLPDAEETNTSTAQIRIDKGKAVLFFALSRACHSFGYRLSSFRLSHIRVSPYAKNAFTSYLKEIQINKHIKLAEI